MAEFVTNEGQQKLKPKSSVCDSCGPAEAVPFYKAAFWKSSSVKLCPVTNPRGYRNPATALEFLRHAPAACVPTFHFAFRCARRFVHSPTAILNLHESIDE
jgi:hypothetical protein